MLEIEQIRSDTNNKSKGKGMGRKNRKFETTNPILDRQPNRENNRNYRIVLLNMFIAFAMSCK